MSLAARLARELAPRLRTGRTYPRAVPARSAPAEPFSVAPSEPALVAVPTSPRALPTVPAGRWVTACKAHDSITGLRCKLLRGHVDHHRSERGVFTSVLAAGATPARRIDEAATRRIWSDES